MLGLTDKLANGAWVAISTPQRAIQVKIDTIAKRGPCVRFIKGLCINGWAKYTFIIRKLIAWQEGDEYLRRLLGTGMLLILLILSPSRALGEDTDPYLMHINQARVDNGLVPLTWVTQLTWAVGSHIEEMAAEGYIAHTGKDGSVPVARAREKGYGSDYVGEVLARNTTDAAQTTALWMASLGHRIVLMDPAMTEIGVWVTRDSEGRLYAGAALGDGRSYQNVAGGGK